MVSLHESYPAIREALVEHYGRPSNTTGAEPPGGEFGRLVGVALDRLVPGRKVESLLKTLGDSGLLEPEAIGEADPSELTHEASSAGLRVNPKTITMIRRLAGWVRDRGGLDALATVATESLREDLRAVPGLGPATVDALLLRGLGRPAYPLDRASYRVLLRHGWIDSSADYDEARDLLERLEPDDPRGLDVLAFWMERLGSEFCRPSVAKCERCPLRPFLPPGGPINPEG